MNRRIVTALACLTLALALGGCAIGLDFSPDGRQLVVTWQKQLALVNADGGGFQGVLYLVTSDTTLSASEIQTIYQKRWKVEEYHKSVKSNASFAKSPTKTICTQSNHIFAYLWAYVKLESLRIKTRMNHFAMKGRLYQAAIASAYRELQVLKGTSVPA